ncbi:molybdenum cofactor biosynthesis protein B [Psychrosphaera sp. B3R10]|uniref:molybdenum cofactor biosynthesis protein B n=1 Tax=unclassified Psychrosphaera TaxID=2641570 RepID=UPI001C08E2FA|nr:MULTISPECIES: molybdenum cofactor biosynthesis protein B [unclassified Psychrosphaera]MBU2880511.1 molybdenum cofactor biosynthesis protein B [Psychrosphaera sp. I2R16]MBU2989603.1 molybdenum cofactor biosynthesis protein B [Psychrosphaera sp. B3R10]
MTTSENEKTALKVCVLTVSDSRNESNDTSGHYLVTALQDDGHECYAKEIVKDDVYQMRATVSNWIADNNVDVILTTGGTGFTSRDSTPEALKLLFDKQIEGFGEIFRHISYTEIGTSTIQSRALAGIANRTVIFCMPGSTGACKTAWSIISSQLDSTYKPCNFVGQVTNSFCTTRG